MTIAIQTLRVKEGGDPEKVRDSERRRFRDPALVDRVIELDEAWIKKQYDMEQLKKELNQEVQKPIAERKKKDRTDACTDLLEKKAVIEKKIASTVEEAETLKKSRDVELGKIGNILCKTVPTSQDEYKDNKVVATWGSKPTFTNEFKYQTDGFRPHFELLEMINGVNFEAGRDVFGSRGYFLTGPAVLLNQALINYGLSFLMREGFTPVQPPFMMRKDVMSQAAELKDYEETLYRVVEEKTKTDDKTGNKTVVRDEENDRFLIATSEQPITALYRNKTIPLEELPLRFAGISSCFRKEAGSSGRDIRGIFRCHQFEKVEQFIICDENLSQNEHENIISQAQKFYQSLGLAYRVVTIVSGEINDAASKKYDLEGWFPGEKDGKGEYRELVSASNCTCYQSRRMNTKAGFDQTQQSPHMLNSTLCATGRVICCILENYQTKEGIRVPRVLQPFMAGMEFIPFVKPPPKDESAKKKEKAKK